MKRVDDSLKQLYLERIREICANKQPDEKLTIKDLRAVETTLGEHVDRVLKGVFTRETSVRDIEDIRGFLKDLGLTCDDVLFDNIVFGNQTIEQFLQTHETLSQWLVLP